MKAVDGGKFYKEYLLKTSFKGETSEPCNPYFFLFPLNSWSFSFFFFLKQYLPPTTSNDEQLFFCVLLVWSVLHPTPESNMAQRGGKTKSKKRGKGPKDIDKKNAGISGGFFYERYQSSPFYDWTIKQYLECCFCKYNQMCVKAKVKVLIAQYAFTLLITKHQRRSKNPLICFWDFSHCVFFCLMYVFFCILYFFGISFLIFNFAKVEVLIAQCTTCLYPAHNLTQQ